MKLFGRKEYPFYMKSHTTKKKIKLDLAAITACAESYESTKDQADLLLSTTYSGKIQDFKTLCDAGLDPESLMVEGEHGFDTVLTVAIYGGKITTVNALVTEHDVNPLHMGTAKRPLYGNAFHVACFTDNFDIVKLLYPGFKAGLSEYDYRNNSTPIACAIGNGNFDCAKNMIEYGYVDITQNCMKKIDVLGIALSCVVNGFIGHASSARKNELVAFCNYLIDEKGMNPFVAANGNKAPIDVLIEEGLGIAKPTHKKPVKLVDIANENSSDKSFSGATLKFDHLYLMLIRLNITHPECQPLAQKLLDLAKVEYADNSSPEAKRYLDAYAYFESQNPQLKLRPTDESAQNSQSASSSLSSDQ